MSYDINALRALIEKGKNNKDLISFEELHAIVPQDSDDYDDVLFLLENEGIDIVSDENLSNLDEDPEKMADDFDGFIGDLDSDQEFLEFSNEIENELKNKDIDDLVSNITSVQTDDPVKMYLKEIGQIPLLTAARELELSSAVQTGLSAESALHAIEIGKKKATEKDIEKLNEAVEEGRVAFDILTESNLRLVVSIAKKFLGRGMQFQDLIQEGNMGLMKAVKKFDHTRGFKFSTYATWWIKQAITRAIADQARTIRIPVHMVETINKMTRIQRQLTQELGREPTAEEIADRMEGDITPERVRQIQRINLEPVSLETPIGEEDDSHLGDFIEDKEVITPNEYASNELLKNELQEILKELTPREAKVLQLRYGLEDNRPHTLEEVGREFNVTRERIRQIEAKALRKLRHPSRSKKLGDYREH